MLRTVNLLFPLWALIASAIAWWQPALLADYGPAIVPLLSLIMFLMGLTLVPADFTRIAQAPRAIGIGVVLQFLLMPLAAFGVAALLRLPEQLAVGLIIVGCCGGGTASNVICYLARGNVALSITMTLVSTILGVLLVPLLCRLYIAQDINIDYFSMLVDIARMVLAPVAPVVLGVLINTMFRSQVRRFEGLLPSLAIAAIIFIIAIIVALNHARLSSVGMATLLAVILHNLLGLVGGFSLARLAGLSLVDSRTVAIEVGMQNSGLGVALAFKYFSATAALPGAVFSVWHNISGSCLASWWGRKPQAGQVAFDAS